MSEEATTNPTPMRLRAEPPRVTRLSRKMLAGAGAVALLGIGGALIYALQTRDMSGNGEELYSTENRATADGLAGLPKDYTGPVLGPALPGDLGGPILDAQNRGQPVTPPAMATPGERAFQAAVLLLGEVCDSGHDVCSFGCSGTIPDDAEGGRRTPPSPERSAGEPPCGVAGTRRAIAYKGGMNRGWSKAAVGGTTFVAAASQPGEKRLAKFRARLSHRYAGGPRHAGEGNAEQRCSEHSADHGSRDPAHHL